METLVGGAVIGAAVGLAAPSLFSGITGALRPLVKEVIKGGIVAYTAITGAFSETSEHFSDLVAEAKAELNNANENGAADKAKKGNQGGHAS